MDRLAELRERRALTLRELSEMSGVAADTINQIELGHRKARPSTLRKLAKALDVDVRELFEEPALSGKVEAPREAGPEDGETPVRLSDAEVLSTVAALWEAQLSRGHYDEATLRKMYITAGVLVMNHVSNVGESRGNLRPDLLAQLEAAEERFAAVDNQVLEILEKIPRGHAAPQDELDKKRRERFQEMRGAPQARHA